MKRLFVTKSENLKGNPNWAKLAVNLKTASKGLADINKVTSSMVGMVTKMKKLETGSKEFEEQKATYNVKYKQLSGWMDAGKAGKILADRNEVCIAMLQLGILSEYIPVEDYINQEEVATPKNPTYDMLLQTLGTMKNLFGDCAKATDAMKKAIKDINPLIVKETTEGKKFNELWAKFEQNYRVYSREVDHLLPHNMKLAEYCSRELGILS